MEKLRIIKTDFGDIEYWLTTNLASYFPLHFHDYWLIGYLEEGSHHVFLQHEDFFLEQDCLFLLNAGEVHTCRGASKGIWHGLHLSAEFIGNLSFSKNKLFNVNIIKKFELILEFKKILEEFITGSVAVDALMEFIKNICLDQESPMQDAEKNILPYNEKLNLEYASVASLSNKAKVCKYRFIHKFTERYGISPHKFIMNMRLIRARKMLAQGYEPLDAALSGGFYDQPHFNKIFRKNFGYTPGFYQRALVSGCGQKSDRKAPNE